MATYVLPQVLVFQEFRVNPAAAANPLRAHISGPHAYLLRYAEDAERSKGRLGYYDRLLDTGYAWPDRPAGGKVDFGYVKLWAKDALLQYYEDTVSAGSVITKTAGYNNRIRSATVSFADNGAAYPKSAALLDRGVKVGDVAKVRGLDGGGDPVTLWTYVKRLIGDPVAAVVGAAAGDDANADTQLAGSSVTQISGPENCIVPVADHTDYDGLADGDITETYDILVLESSVNGDFTTARLRVISGSGNDDVAEVTPAASGSPTAIGTRGLTVTFTEPDEAACSASAAADGVSPDDLIAGQRWQVTVSQTFTAPTPTSGGAYDHDEDTTYVIEVTRGGTYAGDAKPQVSVTTTNGIDLSGPTNVTGAATAVAVGSHGVEIEFSGTALRKGDKYYVTATGEAEGPLRTIELGHNLSTDIAPGSEVDLTLFIRKPLLEVPRNREGFAPETNWDVSETEITVNSGIIAYDETWTDDGVQQPLDVYSEASKQYGELFVEYRAWRPDLCGAVGSIQDVGLINDLIEGPLHPDNPLKWGVFKALENANGSEVLFTAVCDPDDASSWADVLELLLGRDDAYGLVPLTRDRTVLDLYAAHVASQASPEQGLWRVLWTSLEGLPEIPVVHAGSAVAGHTAPTTSDGEVALAVIEDDPLTSGSQYTVLRCTSANADFLAAGVRAGDIVRTLYTGDGFGNFVYSEFIVDEVQSEDQLRLLAGPAAPVSVAAKFEVWRNLTATEEAAAIAANAGSWGSRRVRAVWPDTVESSGTVMEGYHLAAALAGLSSGILPHQGMTNLEVVGFTGVGRTVDKFNRAQLDAMAVAGTWIVTQDRQTGQVFTRHAVTTGDYEDINAREEMIVRNVDSISYRFKDHFAPFIGITNVTPSMQDRLDLETTKLIDTLKTEQATTELGGQLVDGSIVEIAPHATLLDRFVITIDIDVPEPFNNAEVRLIL